MFKFSTFAYESVSCHVVIFMFFICCSNPTPNITNNITWEIFNDYNLTYLIIDEHAHLWFQYRQNKYGFWKDFIPKYAVQDYCKYCGAFTLSTPRQKPKGICLGVYLYRVWTPHNSVQIIFIGLSIGLDVGHCQNTIKHSIHDGFILHLPYFFLLFSDIPTATPTPQGQDYKWGLGGVTAIFIILLIIVAICVYLLVLQSRREAENELYADSQLPLSFSRSQSQTTVLSHDQSKSSIGAGRYPYPGSYEYGGRDYSQDYANRSYGGYDSGSQPYGSQYKQKMYGYGYDKDVSYSDSYASQSHYN